MTWPRPDFPPLFPSGEWWRLRFPLLLEGLSPEESARGAGERAGIRNRDWMRFAISTGADAETVLSVPVTGGGSTLKNRAPDSWMLPPDAAHHILKIEKTLATIYGAEPYFPYVAPEISLSVLFENDHTPTAAEVCRFADDKIIALLGLADGRLAASLKEAKETNPAAIQEKTERASKELRPELSILDILFRHGREAIFAFIPTF